MEFGVSCSLLLMLTPGMNNLMKLGATQGVLVLRGSCDQPPGL